MCHVYLEKGTCASTLLKRTTRALPSDKRVRYGPLEWRKRTHVPYDVGNKCPCFPLRLSGAPAPPLYYSGTYIYHKCRKRNYHPTFYIGRDKHDDTREERSKAFAKEGEKGKKKWHSVRQEKKMKVGQGELMKSNKGSQN